MAYLYGQALSKQEILRHVGSIQQLANVRRVEYRSGRAAGMQAYEVTNGPLTFTVLTDKCMDIGSLAFQGLPLSFLARPGLMSNRWYATGSDATRGIMGGMMFTCGLGNVGPAQYKEDGTELPKHGLIRTTPADTDGVRCYWENDDYHIELFGEVREASLFGENLVLRRTISTVLGSNEINIHDIIENEGCFEAPLMLMYHCNVGFPLLDKDATLLIDAQESKPRDATAAKGIDSLCEFGAPVDGFEEQVFYHRLAVKNGRRSATLVSPNTGLSLEISFDAAELPNLIQWKCRASGDYVMGIEPSNCYPEGLDAERKNDTLRILKPGELIETDITFTVLEASSKQAQ